MDKSKLLVDRVTTVTGTVDIPGLGTIKLRALSRHEMIEGGKLEGVLEQERYILSRAMIDPPMEEHEIVEWQKCSIPGEINAVATKVNELSGIGKGADKSAVPGV
jgi:hypothetical protein